MNIILSKTQLRITALWAFSEALLGGILHGFHIPFTGLILSAFATVCMAALTLQDHQRGKILKATILVIIVKAVLSPHTPPTAYFAVFLQGAFGELIFSSGLPYKVSCWCNGIFALLQTAFQKLLVLTILFGMDLWHAIDAFMKSAMQQMGVNNTSFSYYIVGVFILLHLIAGIIAGTFAARLPKFMQSEGNKTLVSHKIIPQTETTTNIKRKTILSRPLSWLLFLFLMTALYKMYFGPEFENVIESKVLKLMIRATLLMALWYYFISPVLLKWFRKWIMRQKNKFTSEVEDILLLIPEMKQLTAQSWVQSAGSKGFRRINKFLSLTFYSLVTYSK